MTVKLLPYRDAEDQREVYCRELAEHGDAERAGEVAGYTPGSARTLQYRPEIKRRVAELCGERLAYAVPTALSRMVNLLDSDLPTVQLSAAREILSRGGLPELHALAIANQPQRSREEIYAAMRHEAYSNPRQLIHIFGREILEMALATGGIEDDQS